MFLNKPQKKMKRNMSTTFRNPESERLTRKNKTSVKLRHNNLNFRKEPEFNLEMETVKYQNLTNQGGLLVAEGTERKESEHESPHLHETGEK